jgi:hypothetical protein
LHCCHKSGATNKSNIHLLQNNSNAMTTEISWHVSDAPFRLLDEGDDIILDGPTLAPTASTEFVTSTDAEIIRETFRVYGSLYLFFFICFCVGRKYLPRLYNIRSWVPEMECELAKNQEYGFIAWCWQVFKVTDDQLLENCGMDALCYLRCLRLGARLSLFGILQAAWLIPVYLTAEESEETAYLTDIFVKMSIANLPNKSTRFLGAVVAMYAIILYSMYLVTKEYDWFTEYRHKFLSQRKPRNYACYISGIPPDYRSSVKLADYFRQCSLNTALLEAHIAIDTPSLDAKVAKREKLVAKLEHALALERKKGRKQTHRTFKIQDGVEAVKKVDSVDAFRSELSDLNRKIRLEIGEISNANHPLRKHLVKNQRSSDLAQSIELSHPTNASEVVIAPKEPRSVRTLSTVDTQDRMSDRASMAIQPFHLEQRVGSFNEIHDNEFKFHDRFGLLAADGSSGGNLGTITELADIASGHMQQAPEPMLARSESPQSESDQPPLPAEDIPQHPFLSMFGLDASFFANSYEDVTRRLNRSASDSDLTASVSMAIEDEASSENGELGSHDPNSDLGRLQVADHTDVVDVDGDRTEANVDIEEGQKSHSNVIKSSSIERSGISRRTGSHNHSWSSARASVGTLPQSVKRRVGELGANGVRKVSSGTTVVSSRVRNAMKDVNRDAVSASIKKAGNVGAQGIKTASSIGVASVKKAAQTIQYAPDFGASIAATAAESAAALVPVLLQKTDGVPKEAGFVVFNDLYSTQAARQMLHHPTGKYEFKFTSNLAGKRLTTRFCLLCLQQIK